MATVDSGMLTDWYKSYMSSQPKATGYDAAQATSSTVQPSSNSTVQGQLAGVLDKGGPLADRAETRAKQAMNGKGLLNTSMAITAGQSALYDAALPIAQQDAKTYADADQLNAQLGTQVSLSNAGAKNDAAKFGADAANQAQAQQRSAGIQSEQTAQQRAEAQAGREFTTSERLGTQAFQASESALGRQQQSMLQTTDLAAQAQRQITQIQADAAAQGRALTAQEQSQVRDLQAQAQRQAADITSQQTMQQAGFQQQTSMQANDIANQQAMQRAGFTQQSALQAQDLAAQAAQQQRELASRYDLASLDANSRMALQQADAANQQKLQAANAALQTGLQANDLAVKQTMQQYDAAVQQAMNGQNNENKLKLAQMDADTRTNMAEIEAKYKNQLQANSSMATTYQSYADAVTRIMLDTNLDADAKKSAIENQRVLYNNSLSLQSDVSGLKLGTLLAAGQATSAPPVASPAASPSADKIIDQMKEAWLRQQNQREQP